MLGVLAIPHPMLVRGEATTLEEEEILVSAAGKASVEEDGKVCVPLILYNRCVGEGITNGILQNFTLSTETLYLVIQRYIYTCTRDRLATARGVTAWALLSVPTDTFEGRRGTGYKLNWTDP